MDNLSLFFLIFGFNNKYTLLDQLMVFGAEYLIYLAFILMFILALRGGVRERKVLLLALISIPVTVVIIKAIHLFTFTPRPFVSHELLPLITYTREDASFPSRHTSLIAAIAFVYTYSRSRWSTLFLGFCIWIGISRIYVGVHYPIDILGGVGVGLSSLLVSLKLKKILKLAFKLN